MSQIFSLVSFLLIFTIDFLGAEFEKSKLIDYKKNVHSQFGEDGMIEAIFNLIGAKSKRCVEFGAWDGFYFSNTANLFSKKGWEAILIECDKKKYEELIKNVNSFHCKCICEAVGIKKNSLESILIKNKIPFKEVDLLSIDIDGNDYYIFASLEKMKPRVIICEYNPTFPAHLDIYFDYDNKEGKFGFGCSVGALIRLAKQKGYTLVGLTEVNAFFVLDEELPHFNGIEISLEKIRMDKYLNYMITDFNGNYAIISEKNSFLPFGCKNPLQNPIMGDTKRIIPTPSLP